MHRWSRAVDANGHGLHAENVGSYQVFCGWNIDGTGKVVWGAPGHGKEVLTSFFSLLTEEQRNAIKVVSADGAKWIASCIEEYCPNAVRCIDPFHVVEWVNEALSKVRIDSWNDAKKNAAPAPKRKVGRPPKGTAPKGLLQRIQLHPKSKAQNMR